MEENHASRFNLTSVNFLDNAPNKSSKFLSFHDGTSTEGETLTDRDGVTDHITDSGILQCQSPQLPNDPVFGYRLDSEISKIVDSTVFDVSEFGTISKFVSSHIEWGLEPGSFLVTNLSAIASQFKQWKCELPMVEPFYAVKCNPDPVIVRLLAQMGCNFDCATMGEIDLVLNGLGENLSLGNRGLADTSIVYANPAKMASHLQFAVDNDVRLTVFDGEDELYKIASISSSDSKLDLLLRIATNDSDSVCVFSHKFGCQIADAPRLLSIAQKLGLHVAGVCFHVGSGCRDPSAYTDAMNDAFKVFEAGRSLGMKEMTVVDIGGGFPGDKGDCYGGPGMPTFQDLAKVIRESIKDFNVKVGGRKVRYIAEPGRYFASAATSVATKVYARKGGHGGNQALYVDDGVYGTFNSVLYDHAKPVPKKVLMKKPDKSDDIEEAEPEIPTAIFGPTCDGLDQMCDQRFTKLPHCKVNDWVLWDNMGAYTHTASFVFNGYTHIPNKLHCML